MLLEYDNRSYHLAEYTPVTGKMLTPINGVLGHLDAAMQHFASAYNHVDIAKELIENGANLDIVGAQSFTIRYISIVPSIRNPILTMMRRL